MSKEKDKKIEEESTLVCENCGNAMIWESFDGAQDGSKDPKDGEWMCPHCQGEIDFFGDDEKLD